MVTQPKAYVPEKGDVVWINLDPQAGHEQSGRRPAIILSSLAYNEKIGLAVLCPITSRAKGYPFEVVIPPGLVVSGVVLSDQVKSVDWKARNAVFICQIPDSTKLEVVRLVYSLLQ